MRKYIPFLSSLLMIITFIASFESHAAQMKMSGDLEVKGDFILKHTIQPLVFPDGTTQTTAAPSYFATVIVSPGATEAESGANLQAALLKITDASAAKRYLMKIEPGIYDVGTGSVAMKAYVDIEGSGENCTRITGNPDGRHFVGVVNGASNSCLRLITVEHLGGIESAVAIRCISSALTIDRVSIIASGTDNARGIEHSSSELNLRSSSLTVSSGRSAHGIVADNSELKMSDFTITSNGSSGARGMLIDNSNFIFKQGTVKTSGAETSFSFSIHSSTGGMENVKIFSSGTGHENNGILIYSSEISLSDVLAEASGAETNNGISVDYSTLTIQGSLIKGSGGANARGIYNESSSLVITSTIAEGSGGSAGNGGIIIQGEANSVKALYSTFKGADKSIGWGTGWIFDLAGCKLDGPFGTGIGTWRCAGCYNGSYSPLNAGCQTTP